MQEQRRLVRFGLLHLIINRFGASSGGMGGSCGMKVALARTMRARCGQVDPCFRGWLLGARRVHEHSPMPPLIYLGLTSLV